MKNEKKVKKAKKKQNKREKIRKKNQMTLIPVCNKNNGSYFASKNKNHNLPNLIKMLRTRL